LYFGTCIEVLVLRAFVREAWVLRWPWKGATTREVFETYVKHFLAPVLKPGQVMVMDNLEAYKPERVRQLIEARGCELIYLRSYSPDLKWDEKAEIMLRWGPTMVNVGSLAPSGQEKEDFGHVPTLRGNRRHRSR
jgi:hypothetical protein